jgi:hypothetical protein
MRMRHALTLAAAVLAVVITPTAAHADTRFYADSGDRCPYGITVGVLASMAPQVIAKGTLTDQPSPTGPGICVDDRFFSVATFTAYAGARVVDEQLVRADNSTVRVGLVLGPVPTVVRIDRVVIQVCRHPLFTLPPSYCGRPTEYRAPF